MVAARKAHRSQPPQEVFHWLPRQQVPGPGLQSEQLAGTLRAGCGTAGISCTDVTQELVCTSLFTELCL